MFARLAESPDAYHKAVFCHGFVTCMKLYTRQADAKGDWVLHAEKSGGSRVGSSAAAASIDVSDIVRRESSVSSEAAQHCRVVTETARARKVSVPRPLHVARADSQSRQGPLLRHQLQGHALENPNAKMPTEPFFFAKLADLGRRARTRRSFILTNASSSTMRSSSPS